MPTPQFNGLSVTVMLVVAICPHTVEGLSFKLVGGGPSDGLVHIDTGSENSPVCVLGNFSRTMAKVICHKMGMKSSQALNTYPYRYRSDIIHTAEQVEIVCPEGGSTSECTIKRTENSCSQSSGIPITKLAAVLCTDEALEYRLTDQTEDNIGQLEIKMNGTWGPVCARATTVNAGSLAQVSCRSLGLPSTDARYYSGLFTKPDQTGSLGQISCKGNEARLGDCEDGTWGQKCGSDNYLGVACADAHEGKIRMMGGGRRYHEGPVEVYHNEEWCGVGTYPSGPSALDANVTCRSFNFTPKASYLLESYFSTRLWLNDVQCNGNENNLLECSETSLNTVMNPVNGQQLVVSCTVASRGGSTNRERTLSAIWSLTSIIPFLFMTRQL